MERTETFYMPLYKCKCCGEIFSEPQLEDFEIIYNDMLTQFPKCELKTLCLIARRKHSAIVN